LDTISGSKGIFDDAQRIRVIIQSIEERDGGDILGSPNLMRRDVNAKRA
jgi:hypothetical protein